jgi:hypothetical protein
METIGHACTRDQRRVMALLEAAVRDPASLGAFTRRLDRHLRIAEEILFPAVNCALQTVESLGTRTLARQHGVIRELMKDLERIRARPGAPGLDATLRELKATLELHFSVEASLFPIVDHLLSPTTICDMADLLEDRAMPAAVAR